MAIVVNKNEVIFNGIRYPTIGGVRPALMSKQPQKQVIGDYSLDSNPVISTWATKDLRGGMLIEEMDERKDVGRYWWSTCDTRFRGGTTLPPLATLLSYPDATNVPDIVNAGFETLATADNAGWNWSQSGISQDSAQEQTGVYCMKLNSPGADTLYTAGQYLIGWTPGVQYTFSVSLKTTDTTNFAYRVGIHDGVTPTWSTSGNSATYEVKTVQKTMSTAALYMRIVIEVDSTGAGGEDNIYADDASITMDSAAGAISYTGLLGNHFADFDGKSYIVIGDVLTTLNSGNTELLTVYHFNSNDPTDLVVSNDGKLLIYMGDSTNYYFMVGSTATHESYLLTQTDVALANKGIRWDAKTWKQAVDGRWWYATSPSDATATANWTAGDAVGGLDDYDLTPQSLEIYRDADGDPIVYCATKERGLWAYNFTIGKWVETDLTLPNHPTSGLGFAAWHGGLHVSAGLSIHRYTAGTTALIESIGLDQGDGMPQLRNGEIVKFVKGYNNLYALVDSVYEGATSRSQVVAWDSTGWRTIWEATANNKHMYSGIVTSVNKHQLLFSTTDGVYSIPIQRTTLNPKKVSGYTYATGGTFISSWFDADAPNLVKTGIAFYIKARGTSAVNETVIAKYRLDHTYTDLATGWVDLGTIVADGVTEYALGSSAGIAIKAIQYYLALTSTSSSANSPIVEWVALEYLLNNPIVWGYQFTIDCTKAYAGKAPATLVDAIRTATALTTLATLSFRNDVGGTETYYGKVWDISGDVQTGQIKEGQFTVLVVAP